MSPLTSERVDVALVGAELDRFTALAERAIGIGRSLKVHGYLVLIDLDAIELLVNGAELPPTACVTLASGRSALIYRPTP